VRTKAVVAGVVLMGAGAAAAGADAAGEASAGAAKPRIEVTGFVDLYYTYDFNRPVDHANWFTGVGTSARRDNEFAINLAQVDFVMAPAPVGFHLAAGYGTALDVVHGAEAEAWRNLVQASIQYQTGVGRGLYIEAGVFPSHIGFETLQSKDNWNYTRSWLGEFSPYYQTGVKVACPFGKHWSTQVHILNGWQMIADNNRGKTLGWQFAYAADTVSLSFNGLVGPELTDDDHDLRALIDTVAVWRATTDWTFALSFDLGGQEQPSGGDARWEGVGLYARLAPPGSRTALALRAEYYDDEDGAISGTPQILREFTATLEVRPVDHLILKIEGRYDRSSADVFAGDAVRDHRDQALLLVGAVAAF